MWNIILAIAGGIITISSAIGVILKYTESGKKWRKGRRIIKLKKLASEINPYCVLVCPSAQLLEKFSEGFEKLSTQMEKVDSKIEGLSKEIQNTKELSVATLGDALKTNAQKYLDREYATQEEKDEMLKGFLKYFLNGGNGLTQYKVNLALKLPTHKDGNSVEVDLSEILKGYTKH